MPNWIYAVGVIFIIALICLPGLYFRGSDRRIAKQIERERAERETAEAHRIAALPKLDTSRMLEIQKTDEELESHKKSGGTFGGRYIHMIVIDRDGRNYLCFKTPHNLEALWRSEFHQTSIAPYLVEHEENFFVDNEEISVYPHALKKFDRNSLVWRMWAKLHREYYALSSNADSIAYNKFFDYGVPREIPLSQASA